MNLSYRARRALRRLGIGLLILLLVFLVGYLCWVIWLERYVIYTRDGARLDFNASVEDLSGEAALPPTEGPTVSIYYNEGEDAVTVDTSLTQLTGYYADTAALVDSIASARQITSTLPEGTAVLVDVKSIYGNFYYHTKISGATLTDSLDTSAMESFLEELHSQGLYTIARVPAFRDRSYGMEHTNQGLAMEEGYLWADEERCYWLDPANSGVLSYLAAIAGELRDMGFDEVVFSEFRFPVSEEIVYPNETPKEDILAQAADNLVRACTTETFAVSFQSADPAFRLPAGRSRLFLEGVAPTEVTTAAEAVTVEDRNINLVFLADNNDTRYNDFGVLRPLTSVG